MFFNIINIKVLFFNIFNIIFNIKVLLFNILLRKCLYNKYCSLMSNSFIIISNIKVMFFNMLLNKCLLLPFLVTDTCVWSTILLYKYSFNLFSNQSILRLLNVIFKWFTKLNLYKIQKRVSAWFQNKRKSQI